ncbi:hypothetical protein [Saccharicrinis fermentans]|uniref:hypothetical protein n=1 Tax=Saccharicrinis fermentans TaxID=982 RepID=UPI0004AEC030|nr:hypothetical protein [Saccharicrinis fermentans]
MAHENCVKNRAANKQTGAERQKAMNVTYNDPKIKGRKPNSFWCGSHMEDVINSFKDFSSIRGWAFKYSPVPIASGSARMVMIEIIIHDVVILDKRLL